MARNKKHRNERRAASALAAELSICHQAALKIARKRRHLLTWTKEVARVARAYAGRLSDARSSIQSARDDMFQVPEQERGKHYAAQALRLADVTAEAERRLLITTILEESDDHIVALAVLAHLGVTGRASTARSIVRAWQIFASQIEAVGRHALADELATESLWWLLQSGRRVVELLEVDPATLAERAVWQRAELEPGVGSLSATAKAKFRMFGTLTYGHDIRTRGK